ncbi:DUF7310 family coiled-coil domain-containing protein [Halorubrum sp. AS12]|uniref:DUF7310 family coiled-coil domain-containing protein n=1 Tax=Halorubrum sp. AS12 TaxID=3409687 RepID=UPI003DA6D570
MTDHVRDSDPSETGTESASAEANGSDGRIESRLRAVERAVAGNDARPADLAADAEATAERERLESRIADLEDRVAELEAATQAIRGYAGSVRAVNREVERRADLALARATEAERESDRAVEIDGVSRSVSDGESAVPSESALDAALPDDRPASGPGTGSDGDGRNDGDDGAWATDALDRLRESL